MKGDRGPGCKGFVKIGNEVIIGDQPTELFPAGTAQSGAIGPLVLTLDEPGQVLIQFSGVASLTSAPDAQGIRYQVLVNGEPVRPTVPEIMLSPPNSGETLAVTTLQRLSAGTHTVQVVAQAAAGSTYTARNLALTAKVALF